MHSKKKELLEALDKIQGVPVLVAGDLMLDRYVWGKVDRISPEAPVPVVKVVKIEDRLGGAGNVARNLAALGAKVNLCGFIGDDEEGQILLRLMSQDHIGRDGVIIDRNHPTSLKTRVIAHSQQVTRIDREDPLGPPLALQEGFGAVIEAHIDQCRVVILSDYGKGAISEPVMKRFYELQKSGKISLAKRPLVIDPHPVNYGLYCGMSVAKPNRKEAEEAVGIKISNRESAEKVAKLLLNKWNSEMMLITLGEDGLLIAERNGTTNFLETVAQEVHDVSGAGDTVTAVFSAAIGSGSSPLVSGDLANIAAGVVVSEVGTVAVDPAKLRREIERLSVQVP